MIKNKAKLVPKKIRDKNGKATTVWVKTDVAKVTKSKSVDEMTADEVVKEAFDPKGKFVDMKSIEIYTQGGKLSKGRAILHDKIVKDHFKGAKKYKKGEQITSMMMGGAPASGKSSVVDGGFLNIPEGTIHIDADNVKKKLPEYQVMSAKKDIEAAPFTHKESSMITEKVLKKGTAENYSVMLDGTGDKSFEHVSSRVKVLRDAGHRVVANYVTMDTELSVMLNKIRFKTEHRLVPEDYVRSVNRDITGIVTKAIETKLFDELHLFDTNIENKPRKILTFVNGELEIHDKNLYKVFLKKGNEKVEVKGGE